MEQIISILEKHITCQLIQAVISNKKATAQADKIKIRPILLKEELFFQIEIFKNKQVFHENIEGKQICLKLANWIQNDYKQMDIQTECAQISIIVSKKGKISIKEKVQAQKRKQENLSHNRTKNYILEIGKPIAFLIDLGIQTPDGTIIKAKYDKFRQINRFLEFVEDIVPALPKDRQAVIIDFGCGKSYLTFAMYYYLKQLRGYDIKIIGLDLKEEVIDHCNQLRTRYGFEQLEFLVGDIAQYKGVTSVDMVVTLHACDTATDYALHKAVQWGANVILSVPCCQHELNRQIQCEQLESIFKYGLIKERVAALVTDALRGEILEQAGYQVQILEFIDMEHTPKNILIRGVKQGKKPICAEPDYKKVLKLLNVSPTLEQLQNNKEEKS